MTIPTPPVGARVRHTTTYADGTAVTLAGAVVPNANHNLQADPYLLIGEERLVGYLTDRPGVYTVAVEVLEPSGPPPEPADGTVYSDSIDAWIRNDHSPEFDHEGRWWKAGAKDYERWSHVAPLVAAPGWRRYVPDPADTAPALPWEVEDKDEDSFDITVSDVEGVAVLVTVNNQESVYLAPAAAREAAGVLLRAVREFEERQR